MRARNLVRIAGAMVAAVITIALATACSPKTSKSSSTAKQNSGKASFVIWADPGRIAIAHAYATAHPDVKVKIEQVPNDAPTLAQKLGLANKAGSGWPDIMFVSRIQAPDLAKTPLNFAADISTYLPSRLMSKFEKDALVPCVSGKAVYCLPNDVSPVVLFYNPQLMSKFDYAVPTTWEQYEALGIKAAKEHPGYISGTTTITTDQVNFASARCPVHQVVGHNKLLTNLSDPSCVKVAHLIDSMIRGKAMATTAPNSPAFTRQYGAPGKVLMMPGPIFQAATLFNSLYKTKPGDLAVAPPLKWADGSQVYNGSVGGTTWVVSRHSHYIKAAADAVVWMTTGPVITGDILPAKQAIFSAYMPGQQHWVDVQNKTHAIVGQNDDLEAVMTKASSEVWGGWTEPNIPNTNFLTVNALLAKGKTVEGSLSAWQTRITNEAKSAGWSVVNSQ